MAAPVLAQDEGKIWEGLFNYQQKMANLGNAEAQYKLAEMYAQGQGTRADPEQARHWYEASAGQGYAPAQRKLAALAKGEPMVNAAAVPPAAPATPQPSASRQELEQAERERRALEQELARSREEMRKLQEEQARQAAALQKAELEKDEARRRLAAKALLEAEMKKLRETPPAFDQ
ncbi:MAG: SEL1-like repeat protein [Pseudomonadota bacterium]